MPERMVSRLPANSESDRHGDKAQIWHSRTPCLRGDRERASIREWPDYLSKPIDARDLASKTGDLLAVNEGNR